MSTTFKAIVLPHHKKKDGTSNVKILLTHNRKKKYIATNIFVEKEDLTHALNIKSQDIKDQLRKEIEELYQITSHIPAIRVKEMDISEVMDYIDSCIHKTKNEIDFIAFSKNVKDTLIKQGKVGTATNYNTAINSLCAFLGRDTLDTSEITVSFLKNYTQWLMTKPLIKGRKEKKTGRRAPSLYLSNIRALFNRARDFYNDEDTGEIKIKNYPFKKFKIPHEPLTEKRAITSTQIFQIKNLPYSFNKDKTISRFNIAKDVFILSFGLIGMNAVDLYNCTDYEEGVISYQRTKTASRRADKALMKVNVQEEIKSIFEKYRDQTGKRVFNFYTRYSSRETFNKALNKGLKVVGSMIGVADLEFYAARHSWATIARNDLEIDKYTINEALDHVDSEMAVTDIYIKKDFSTINETNKKVLEYVFNGKNRG